MARNKFDVDETLETPFNIKHLLRAGVYIGRHKKKMILSLLFSAISAACSLLGPMLIQRAIDVSVPKRTTPSWWCWPSSCWCPLWPRCCSPGPAPST